MVFKDFNKIFARANEFCETNIISNGLLLYNEKIEQLVKEKNFKVLAISVDTIGNVNRDFKKGQWDFLTKQVNEFVKLRDKKGSKTALDIKTVILEENIQDLFNIHKFTMEKLKADTHSLQLLKGANIQHNDVMQDQDKDLKKFASCKGALKIITDGWETEAIPKISDRNIGKIGLLAKIFGNQ